MTNAVFQDNISRLIQNALEEDLGTGDITTLSVIGEDVEAHGSFKAKEDGIVCGLFLISKVSDVVPLSLSVHSDESFKV